MINATASPNTLRVSFASELSDTRQAEVVCYVRIEQTGLGIYYSHHIWRRRTTPEGPWQDETTVRIMMTPALESEILFNVPNELWSALTRTVRVLPAEPGVRVEDAAFAIPGFAL